MLKIATWNVNSLRVRLPHLLAWLADAQPDIVALQEIKLVDEDFPLKEIADAGYSAIFSGQKSYNGVATLSRVPATDVIRDMPGYVDLQRRVLCATIGEVRIINVYVPNGSEVDSEKYIYKLNWFEELVNFVRQQLTSYRYVVVLGDFNVAPEDQDVHDPDAWRGQVLVSEPERQALRHLLQLGLSDTFRLFEQSPASFSWWDYRMLAFRRNQGLRIDHILASTSLANTCTRSYIDKTPRGWERPSDHTPVIAEFEI